MCGVIYLEHLGDSHIESLLNMWGISLKVARNFWEHKCKKNQIPPHPTFLFGNRFLAPKGKNMSPPRCMLNCWNNSQKVLPKEKRKFYWCLLKLFKIKLPTYETLFIVLTSTSKSGHFHFLLLQVAYPKVSPVIK